jgi:hypothetical protein
VQTTGDIRAFKLRPLGDKSGTAPNTVQTRQAIDAYQRYGQSAPAPTPAPAAAPPPPVVPVADVPVATPPPAANDAGTATPPPVVTSDGQRAVA